MNDINLLTGLYDKQYSSPFCSFQREWDNLKNKLNTFKDNFFNTIVDNETTESQYPYYHFSAGLSDCEKTFTGLKVRIYWNEGRLLFFDKVKRKIYKIEGDKYEEIMPFSSIKYATIRYRPCLIQSIKVRFNIDFTLTGQNGKIYMKLSHTESCYDDDRRSYEAQLSPFVKTCEAIASTGGWHFRKSCSTTF